MSKKNNDGLELFEHLGGIKTRFQKKKTKLRSKNRFRRSLNKNLSKKNKIGKTRYQKNKRKSKKQLKKRGGSKIINTTKTIINLSDDNDNNYSRDYDDSQYTIDSGGYNEFKIQLTSQTGEWVNFKKKDKLSLICLTGRQRLPNVLTLNVQDYPELKYFFIEWVDGEQLKNISFNNSPVFKELKVRCDLSALETVNLTGCTALETVELIRCQQLVVVNLSGCTSLKKVVLPKGKDKSTVILPQGLETSRDEIVEVECDVKLLNDGKMLGLYGTDFGDLLQDTKLSVNFTTDRYKAVETVQIEPDNGSFVCSKVEEIEFSNSSVLSSVIFNTGLPKLKTVSFNNCSALQEVQLTGHNRFNALQEVNLSGCNKLTQVNLLGCNKNNLKKVVIPAGKRYVIQLPEGAEPTIVTEVE